MGKIQNNPNTTNISENAAVGDYPSVNYNYSVTYNGYTEVTVTVTVLRQYKRKGYVIPMSFDGDTGMLAEVQKYDSTL